MIGVSKVSELASAQPVQAGRSVSAGPLLMEIANRRLSWFGREDILDGFVDFLGFRFVPRQLLGLWQFRALILLEG